MLLKANWLGTEVFLKRSVVQVQVTYTHNIKTGLCEVGSSRGPIEVNTTDTENEEYRVTNPRFMPQVGLLGFKTL